MSAISQQRVVPASSASLDVLHTLTCPLINKLGRCESPRLPSIPASLSSHSWNVPTNEAFSSMRNKGRPITNSCAPLLYFKRLIEALCCSSSGALAKEDSTQHIFLTCVLKQRSTLQAACRKEPRAKRVAAPVRTLVLNSDVLPYLKY